jgi:hypothetical protein
MPSSKPVLRVSYGDFDGRRRHEGWDHSATRCSIFRSKVRGGYDWMPMASPLKRRLLPKSG